MLEEDYGQFYDGDGQGPGGDFYWLTKTYGWTTSWGANLSSVGDSHGHNVISPANGILAELGIRS